METLFIFIVWFVIGTFIGSYLAKKRIWPVWTVDDEVKWWMKLIRGRQ